MNRTALILASVAVCFVSCSVYALYSIKDVGDWPKDWPAELEPLRKQSRTLAGPTIEQLHYEIPFTSRETFETAWPHLLKVKSPGAPVFLVRKARVNVFDLKAGVVVHCPPAGTDRRVSPEAPVPGQTDVWLRWMCTNYIELVVDGNVVDLNRIPLPADTPIIDERFGTEVKPAAPAALPAPAVPPARS